MWFLGSHMGGWWWLMMIFYVFFLAGIVILIIFLVKWLSGPERRGLPPSKDEPLEILKRRYAKGEIDKEQFEQMKKDLKS